MSPVILSQVLRHKSTSVSPTWRTSAHLTHSSCYIQLRTTAGLEWKRRKKNILFYSALKGGRHWWWKQARLQPLSEIWRPTSPSFREVWNPDNRSLNCGCWVLLFIHFISQLSAVKMNVCLFYMSTLTKVDAEWVWLSQASAFTSRYPCAQLCEQTSAAKKVQSNSLHKDEWMRDLLGVQLRKLTSILAVVDLLFDVRHVYWCVKVDDVQWTSINGTLSTLAQYRPPAMQ